MGQTMFNVFLGPNSYEQAVEEFKKTHPGENLLALIKGNHESRHSVYPLLSPFTEGKNS